MAITLEQALNFTVFGDGVSTSFSYDLTSPPLGFLVGADASIFSATVIEGPQVLGQPLQWTMNTIYPVGALSNILGTIYQVITGGISGEVNPGLSLQAGVTTFTDGTVTWTLIPQNFASGFDIIPISYAAIKKGLLTLTFSRRPLRVGSTFVDSYGNSFLISGYSLQLLLSYAG